MLYFSKMAIEIETSEKGSWLAVGKELICYK